MHFTPIVSSIFAKKIKENFSIFFKSVFRNPVQPTYSTRNTVDSKSNLIIALCVIFIFLETPLFVAKLLATFSNYLVYYDQEIRQKINFLGSVAQLLTLLDSSANFFIYLLSNCYFRVAIKKMVMCK